MKILATIIVLVILIGGGFYIANNSSQNNQESVSDDSMMKNENIMDDDKMMKDEDSNMSDDDMMKDESAMKKGTYEEYSPEKLSMANDGDLVLFFKASWCPTCRALDSSIKSEISMIPEGLTILYVDYDQNSELKKKYGVTTQHTLVQVDANGNLIKKWSGGNDLNSILVKLN